jgi:TRAP-type transport system periplasmic protein
MAILSRRQTLALAAALPLGPRLAHAQSAASSAIRGQQGKKLTLKFGSSQPSHADNAHTVFFDKFVAELSRHTNGDIGAIFYGDSQLGPEDKYSNQINAGTLDMMLTISDWTPIVPELGVLTMGFLFDSLDQTGKVMDGAAGEQLDALFKKHTHAEVLGWCYNFGARNVLTKTPVLTPADLKGKKLRILPSPVYVQTFRLLGANPVPMSFNEIYVSLQTGVIDGLEHDPPTILAFKFFEIAKHYTQTRHIFDPCAPIISNATMNKLTSDEQQAVRDAASVAVKYQRLQAAAAEARALDQLKQNGMQLHDIDRPALADLVKPLWKSFTDQHPEARPVLDAILHDTNQTL